MSRLRAKNVSLAATLLACLTLFCGFALLTHTLTDSFQHWTFEDVRREHARQGRLRASPLDVRTSRDAARPLWATGARNDGVMLVDFIYTSCPSVCQVLGTEYMQLQRAVLEYNSHDRPGIELVSLSIDARDGPAQLAAYARLHRADDSVWTIAAPVSRAGMTSSLRQLDIVVIPDGIGGFVHNGSIHVMTHTGKVLAIYDDADWRDAFAFAASVAKRSP